MCSRNSCPSGFPQRGRSRRSSRPDSATVRVTRCVRPPASTQATLRRSSRCSQRTSGDNAAAGTKNSSPTRRPRALRSTSGPSAERTGMRPRKRHAVCPDPRVYRSNPRMNSGPRCVVAAQMNPAGGASAQSASNRCQRPTLISPRWCSTAARRNGVPGAIACSSHRRAGAGRPSSKSSVNGAGSMVARPVRRQSRRNGPGSAVGASTAVATTVTAPIPPVGRSGPARRAPRPG